MHFVCYYYAGKHVAYYVKKVIQINSIFAFRKQGSQTYAIQRKLSGTKTKKRKTKNSTTLGQMKYA